MCLQDGIFSDFTILSEEGGRFPCHRVVLAANSSYMKTMMTTKLNEEEQKQHKLPHNISNQVAEAFVAYFYKGEVTQEVLEANLSTFLDLSEFYDLGPMKGQVEDAAIKNLSVENMVEMFSLANIYNARTLNEATSYFIAENKRDISQQDFSEVPASVLTQLTILLSQS